MIALVAGDESTRHGPIPLALAHAGFEARETADAAEAAAELGACGAANCVLVLDACALRAREGRIGRWRDLLGEHAGVAAVVVSRGEAGSELSDLTAAPHRVLLQCPFDASAVAAAALRASASALRRVQKAPKGFSAGSKYAS